MTKYTTYCTEEQTKRAFNLHAPLNVKTVEVKTINFGYTELFSYDGEADIAEIPTTQQMINWLEIEKGQIIEVCRLNKGTNLWAVFINDTQEVGKYFEQRYEAELYAIDSAFGYLEFAEMGKVMEKESVGIINSLELSERTKLTEMIVAGDIIQATVYLNKISKCGLKLAKTACDYIKEQIQ